MNLRGTSLVRTGEGWEKGGVAVCDVGVCVCLAAPAL